jgi:hypothetical protein
MASCLAMSRTRTAAPWALLAAYTVLLLAISWERWGNPVMDPGLDLTTAANWLHGVMPYRDTRYWYGPLGIGGLSATFALFGTTLWSAWAFGLAQTAVIAELFRRLANQWLPARVALAGVAVILSIGFSGSLFNFQLPHTESATTGLIALLATLLAIARRRPWLAGLAIGAAALTRPEFFAFAVAAAAGMALGLWRTEGFRPAVVELLKMVATTLLIAVPVLGYFAAEAGTHRFFFENIFPLEFLKVAGIAEKGGHPNDLPSVGTLLLRGVLLAGAVWTLLRTIEAWLTTRGTKLSAVRWVRIVGGPAVTFAIVAAITAVVATLFSAIGGDPGQSLRDTGSDIGRLLLPMTGLPAAGFVVLLVAAWSWIKRGPAPLSDELPEGRGPGWGADAALIAAAAACGLRSYGQFSTDDYATYYAAPLVLLAAILVYRAAARLGTQRVVAATTGILIATAAVLTTHAWVGRYADFTYRVHTPRGSFKSTATLGPSAQGVIDLVAPHTRPRQGVLELPQEPGLLFMLRAKSAIYDVTFLPGTLATRAEDERAAADLVKAAPRYVVESSRSLKAWGRKQNGVDVNVALMRAVHRDYCVRQRFGDTATLTESGLPPAAFTVYERRGSEPGC